MLDISLENDIFINNKVDKFLQEIDIVFNTRLADTLNDCRFGSDFERFLWSLKDNTTEITMYVKHIINDYCPSANGMDWDTSCVYLYDENGKEFYYVIIAIVDEAGEIRQKSYVFHDYGRDNPLISSLNI